MRDGESVNSRIANLKIPTCFNYPEIKFCVVNPLNFRGSMTISIDGNTQLGSENAESPNMIGMLVGNKDAIETLRCALE